MVFKSTTFTVAIAATLIATFAGAESSGANAQVTAQPIQTTATEAPLTDEVVPVFVEKAVVQTLPGEAQDESSDTVEAPQAQSLDELVGDMETGGDLSEQLHCLAGAVYFESRGEPLSGQLAVAQTIVNRAADSRFPSTYCGVVFQRAQFSFVRGGRMPRIKTHSNAWKRAEAIARIAHRGLWESKAPDSLYFHAKYVKPSWSRKKTALTTINTHIFYR